MGRLHLVELEDLEGFPAVWRDLLTDFLRGIMDLLGVYDRTAPLVARCLAAVGADRVLDLCSGGAGPWGRLHGRVEAALGRPVRVTLSDRFPNLPAFERLHRDSGGRIGFHVDPLDATAIAGEPSGLRTLFSSFHHFRPEVGRRILEDACRARRGICLFEITERSLPVLSLMLSLPLLVLLVSPLLRPFRPARLLWTYVVPLVPFFVLWDGVVSCLRTYSPRELETMVAELRVHGYSWEVGRLPIRPLQPPITYLLGLPPGPGPD